jgi:murein DD-endopeptidase MepM/ murein hydrolase activator NlpD
MGPRIFAGFALLALFAAIACPPQLAAASCPPKPGDDAGEISLAGAPEFIWPVKGPVLRYFGADQCAARTGPKHNEGIDIAVRKGTRVKAAADGFVQFAGYAGKFLKRYGKLIIIRHDGGWITVYTNLRALAVRRGDKVRQGQTIGRSGRAPILGIAELHFEVRRNADAPVDPLQLLRAQASAPAKIKQ